MVFSWSWPHAAVPLKAHTTIGLVVVTSMGERRELTHGLFPQETCHDMRSIHLAASLALVSLAPLAGAQTTLPYFEDFEASPGGFVNGAAPSEWAWGQPTGFFINGAGAGLRAWVSDLQGGALAASSSLTSPTFDFSGLAADPWVQFLHIFDTFGSVSCYAEVSVDGGTLFSRLGTVDAPGSIHWYNSTQDEWTGASGSAGEWRTARVRLDGTAGFSEVQLRFVVDNPFSFNDEGMGLDDFRLFETFTDVELVAIEGPLSGPGLTSSPVAITVRNNGTETVTGFDVTYQVSGAGSSTVTETFTSLLEPQEQTVFSFDQLLDLSVVGDYQVDISLNLAGDEVPENDARSALVVSQGSIDALPYFQDFEAGPGGFITDSPDSQWQWGQPNGVVISDAASGSNAWVTELSGPYAPEGITYLQSPPIDLIAEANDPFLQFDMVFQIDFSDGCYLELSLNGGPFTRLGTDDGDVGSINWYSFSNEWDGTSFPSGAWLTRRHLLDGAAGKTAVVRWVFRANQTFSPGEEGVGIDNVQLFQAPFGVGQRSRPGLALLDANESTEAIGFTPAAGHPGPYFASLSVANDSLDISFEGAPNQAAILYYGDLSPALLNLGSLGQVDIVNPLLFASGLLSGGINTFFVTNSQGELNVSLTVPFSLIGLTTTLQGAVTSQAGGFGLTNAVQVSFLP